MRERRINMCGDIVQNSSAVRQTEKGCKKAIFYEAPVFQSSLTKKVIIKSNSKVKLKYWNCFSACKNRRQHKI